MPERFIYRDEHKLHEPHDHFGGPIKAILHDIEGLHYHLLQEHLAQEVRSAIEGKISPLFPSGIMQFETPYPVYIDLAQLRENTRVVKPPDLDGPDGVVRAPLSVYFAGIALSPKCPIACIHCYEGEVNRGPDTQRLPMTDQQIDEILEQFHTEGVFTIRFTGPEVTLNHKLPLWINRVRELGMSVSMNTSGFFSPFMRERLIKSGLQEAVFSIEGQEDTENKIRGLKIPNAYQMAVNNLIALSDAGIKTRINMTIGKHNIGDDLDFVAELAAKYCRGGVSLIPLRGLGNANDYLLDALPDAEDMYHIVQRVMILRREYPYMPIFTYHDILDDPNVPAQKYHPFNFQKNPCPAEGNIYITATGLVVGCCQTMSLPNTDGKSFYFGQGDLTTTPFAEVWKNDQGLQRFRDIEISRECRDCDMYGTRCEGGCPAEYITTIPELHDGKGSIQATNRDRLCIINFRNNNADSQ